MATVKRATLFNPKTGKREAVDVDSSRSRELFGMGYQLETASPQNIQIQQNRGLNIQPPALNTYGQTIEEANNPRNWQNGAYMPAQGAKQTTPQINPAQSFQTAIQSLLTQAQKGSFGGNEDLLAQRNALIQKRFGAQTDITPEQLRVLSPTQQESLRTEDMRGIESQLGGVQTALQAREAKQKESRQFLKEFQEQFKPSEPFEFNGDLVRFDPTTGKVEILQEGTGEDQSISDKYGTGIIGEYNDPLVSAIISNPELFSQLTATEKAKIAPALNALGFTAFGKPLSDTAIKEITQSETALESLQELKSIIQTNSDKLGPITGLAALNPYSETRKVQADIDRVKQVVGKALEGGVLRKEDEEKYKKILATVTDTPSTALYKINQLIADVQRNVDTYKSNQALGGRNIPSKGGGDDLDNILDKVGFRDDLSKSVNGSVKKIAEAIGQFESGGNYKAVGPATQKGNKAYGKYQVMDFNIPNWTKEALGKAMTVAQFIANPMAQDLVAIYKMGQLLSKYGTVEDVASAWFTGQPLSIAKGRKDVIGTTVEKYIANIKSILDNLA